MIFNNFFSSWSTQTLDKLAIMTLFVSLMYVILFPSHLSSGIRWYFKVLSVLIFLTFQVAALIAYDNVLSRPDYNEGAGDFFGFLLLMIPTCLLVLVTVVFIFFKLLRWLFTSTSHSDIRRTE